MPYGVRWRVRGYGPVDPGKEAICRIGAARCGAIIIVGESAEVIPDRWPPAGLDIMVMSMMYRNYCHESCKEVIAEM